MKYKFLYLDLIICAVWMLFIFGMYGGWVSLFAAIVMPSVFYRFVLTFSLSKNEIRSWLPLLIYALLSTWTVLWGHNFCFDQIADYFFHLTHIEHDDVIHGIIKNSFLLWLVALPYVYYLFLVIRKIAVRTELTWVELIGAIMWHDNQTKIISGVLMVMLIAFVTGLSMSAAACQIMCFTAAPVTYWLICRYNRVVAEKMWVFVIAMVIFWYAQIMAGVWRGSMLLVCFVMIAYVMTILYKKIKNGLLYIGGILYLGVLLPSFSIGYNQYTCIHYARYGFHYLEPFRGILYIADSKGLFGLRDRYGMLVEPEYENIWIGENHTSYWSHQYILQKDGYNRYYDVFNNKFVQESDIVPNLQHQIRNIIEGYFVNHANEYDDIGQIMVTDLGSDKTIANVEISMKGNPVLCYVPDKSIIDDSIMIISDEFYRNDSVKVRSRYKRSVSYVKDVVRDSINSYRIFVRLVTDSLPQSESLIKIADNVATLEELKQ